MTALTTLLKPAKLPAPVPVPDTEASGAVNSDQLRRNLLRNRVSTILSGNTGGAAAGARPNMGG